MNKSDGYVCIGGPYDGQVIANPKDDRPVVELLKPYSRYWYEDETTDTVSTKETHYILKTIHGENQMHCCWMHQSINMDEMIERLLTAYVRQGDIAETVSIRNVTATPYRSRGQNRMTVHCEKRRE